MSGALPETERERQVRQLAGRLLAWPDPEGPQEVDLIPVGYPEDFPPELVDLTELRFLGSVVRRRAGAVVGVEMVFEGSGEPQTVVSNYEAALLGLGWERIEQPQPPGAGGFDAHGFGQMTLLANKPKSALVFLHGTDREEGGSELRVRYDPVHAPETLMNIGRAMQHEESILPRLKPPPGVRLRPEGTGGGGGRWRSDAGAQTEMAPMELEAYFARQLEAAGWGRMTGSADDTFAWSSWLIPDSGEWRGVLLVLAAFPGWRQLSLSAELIQPGGHRGAGGYAVSGISSSR
ncbi:MAG: hypothetical protein E6I10_05705 [Chloroflexi bacterium]|nr:MAG: hypothetical protein E6I10_05705 [Chloroflexota bacterium]